MTRTNRLTALSTAALSIPASGCALLPQDGTEWTIAVVVTVVLIGGTIVAAIVAEKNSKK